MPPKAAPKANQDSWDSNEFEDLLSPETEVRDAKSRGHFLYLSPSFCFIILILCSETKVLSIASKLENRSAVKPPVGGVSVLPVSSTPVQVPVRSKLAQMLVQRCSE